MSAELEELYRELILDHSRHPVGKGDPATAEHTHHELNPSCGDEITMGVTVDDDGSISRLVWEGQGCSISMASASVMSDMLTGASRLDALARVEEFRAMLRSRGTTEPPESLEDAAAFQGVAKYVMRVKCAMLGWVALEACLNQAGAA
ncbi:Fe-S cluster assembly sulfur transfer protein SufU [Microbacterium marinilacus]|uniref:SUF system NifU family Fe-S cluster assembly protein n=1 Tax=Microbacterium marinilacus TaxID=415209 RepID=A0ABP7B3R0_9MICO|nr:SUF system NifU family Fe-S cluster assembly protein [Microbacterium marinilacus]MBY0688518.1 SUF system NifU family Fe-S cluster assembly protein [Microbacterium marinilacus]